MTDEIERKLAIQIKRAEEDAKECLKNRAYDQYALYTQKSWTLNQILIWDYSLAYLVRKVNDQNKTIEFLRPLVPESFAKAIDEQVHDGLKRMLYEAIGKRDAYDFYMTLLIKEEMKNELI